VGQYSKLESLSIRLDSRETETLDFLTNLPFLKEFSFSSNLLKPRQGPLRRLPALTKLEKLSVYLNGSTLFEMNHIQEFISNNKALKNLSLGLSIQNIANIFGEDDDVNFRLPLIESLHLDLITCQKPYAAAAKMIAQTLKKLDCIKQLSLEIEQSSPDLNAILLKQGVASVKGLEELTLKYHITAGLEDNKFKHLKDVFVNLENLKVIELDLSSDHLSSREFSSLLDSLSRQMGLQKFKFTGKVTKWTPVVSAKLLDFFVSIRHLSVLKIFLGGILEEGGVKIKESLLPKFPLSQDTFSFFPNI